MRHHRLLLDAVGEDAVLSFRDAVLGPLIEYDETRDTDLVATLETFLTAIGGRLDTARELNIHQNTLRYRLARVEALTGTRLADISDRVDLYLALDIHRDHA
jgi:DNA-binding PucR family transcriptional regulator